MVLILFKKYKFMIHRLNIYLTTSAFFQALGFAVRDYNVAYNAQNDSYTHGVCIFESLWTFYFDWVPFLFICCITFNLIYQTISHKSTARFEKFYLVISIGFPAVLAALPFIMNAYGPAGLWCWIAGKRNGETFVPGVIMGFVLYYVPLWILIVAMIIGQGVAVCLHYKQSKKVLPCETHTPKVESFWTQEIKTLLFLPMINILGVTFASINRLRLAADYQPNNDVGFFFWFMHSITNPFHGTFYALVFAAAYSGFGFKQFKMALLQFCTKTAVKDYPMYSTLEADVDNSFKCEYSVKNDDS